MVARNRRILERLYADLYKTREGLESLQVCAYCGDVRETLDHIPALKVLDYLTPTKARELGLALERVPACRPCNGRLGDKYINTYEERLGFLYEDLLRKAEKRSHWSTDELEELGPNLKQKITAKQAHNHREIHLRLRGMEHNLCKQEVKE